MILVELLLQQRSNKEQMLEDKELGTIELIPNSRARRVIVRYVDGAFRLTHPSTLSVKEIKKAIEEMKPNLLQLKEKAIPDFVFTEDTNFSTLSFHVAIKRNKLKNSYASLKDGELCISFSPNVELGSSETQLIIQNVIENACRREANRIFPNRVRKLATEHGFEVKDVKINKSRGRWGSCSTVKDINLSYFCMMLPKHLSDFVMLHELCHTVEMNHGPRFWALLDKASNNKAKELTQQLKQVKLKW